MLVTLIDLIDFLATCLKEAFRFNHAVLVEAVDANDSTCLLIKFATAEFKLVTRVLFGLAVRTVCVLKTISSFIGIGEDKF